ncbi:MAG: VWA domain-containing protein [Spirochaetes bacterium]|nr:VWA domain-containing protein [Spirochaetota bacterium]
MSLTIKRILMLFMGALAASISWPVLLFIQYHKAGFPSYLIFTMVQGMILGLVFGAVFGSFEGIVVSSRRKAFLGMLFGAAFGLFSGALGMLAGQGFLLLAANSLFRSQADRLYRGLVFANGIGWVLIGLFVALVEGLRSRSPRKLLIGLIGGVCGGLAGGTILQLLLLYFPGSSLWLLAGLILFGLALAGFYSFFENRFSAGTLKLLNGAIKGKEYQLTKRETVIGSDNGCDIVLAGYPGVLPRHAVVKLSGRRASIAALDKKASLLVNDEAAAESPLRREDVFALGKAKFFFGFLPALLVLLLFSRQPLAAQSLTEAAGNGPAARITQIDSGRLLTEQTIRLFVDASRIGSGIDITTARDYFKVLESADGSNYQDVEVTKVERNTARDEGISFFFLLDNSGSMWDNLDGQASADPSALRVTHAVNAIRSFLGSVSTRDRVGLAVFNTRYSLVQESSTSIAGINAALEALSRPESADAYTELYNSVGQAMSNFGEAGRRRVLIVLSDGENYPYLTRTGTDSPQFGSQLASAGELVPQAEFEGISIYSVRLGPQRDSIIGDIALMSGGQVFDAANQNEMENVYATIRRQVLEEYTVSYRAPMLDSSTRTVKLQYLDSSNQVLAESQPRSYYAGNLLGGGGGSPHWYHLLFILIPSALIALFMLFRLEKESSQAALQLLAGYKDMQTKVFKLNHAQTIIGGGAKADVTIAGNRALKDQHATILFDKDSGSYTVAGADLMVNNKPVSRRRLEAGDVINMAGTIVVFDDKLSRPKPPASRG